MVSHGILPILSQNFIKFVPLFSNIKKYSTSLKCPHLPNFSTNCRKCQFEQRDGRRKLRNGHGKNIVRSARTLQGFLLGIENVTKCEAIKVVLCYGIW